MSDKIKEIVKSKLVEAGITKGFQNAVESYREESLKLQNLRDEQDELVNRFKKSSPKEKEKLKKDLVSMHKKVQSQKKAVDKAESKFNKMVQDEPEELEESKLRKVKVTYDTGDTVTTSMAANLSDKKIKDYFKKGKEFNIGSGGKDKMAKVKDVEILEGVNEATVAYIKYLNKDKGHKEDIKKFKGKNFFDAGKKAEKWAKKNLDSFNQDMIHYESVNESFSETPKSELQNGFWDSFYGKQYLNNYDNGSVQSALYYLDDVVFDDDDSIELYNWIANELGVRKKSNQKIVIQPKELAKLLVKQSSNNESVNEASMDFYAIKDGKVFRSFPSRKEASIWLRNNGDKYSGVSLRSAKDWERHQQSKNESINEYKGGVRRKGKTLYVDSDFVNSSKNAGTLKHIGMGDFELDVDTGGTLTFSRVSKKFPGFSGRAHEVGGSEKDIKKMMMKMPLPKVGESINEGKPPTPKDVKDWIEGFNNAAWIKTAAGYYLFRASKFALKGIKRELKDSGIRVRSFPKNSYGIPVSQKNDFHWGVNESVNEEYKIDTMGAKKGDWVGVDPHTAEIKKVFKNRGAASRWLNKQSNAEIRPFEDWDKTYGQTIFKEDLDKDNDDPCWDGYVQVGMKKKDGKEVPNCVPIEEVVQANNKIKENMINENFSKSDVNKIKDIVKSSDSLTKLRDPLKDAGFKNVDFAFSPIPHFMIKKGGSKYIILNKKYAEDPDWTIGKVSGGILEGVVSEGCGECGGTVNESKAKEYKGFKISKGGFQKMWFIIDPPDDMEPYRTTLRDAKKEIDKWLKKHKKDVRESINERTETLGKYQASIGGGLLTITYDGTEIGGGDFDRGADGFFVSFNSSDKNGQEFFDDLKDVLKYAKKNNIKENCDGCGGTVNETRKLMNEKYDVEIVPNKKGKGKDKYHIVHFAKPLMRALRDKFNLTNKNEYGIFDDNTDGNDPSTIRLRLTVDDKKDVEWIKNLINSRKYSEFEVMVNESINKSINESVKPSKTIEKVMDIVDKKSAKKIGGTLVDHFTASLIKQVYEMGQDKHKKMLNKMDIHKLSDVAFKIARK